jgi:hypothetical protein
MAEITLNKLHHNSGTYFTFICQHQVINRLTLVNRMIGDRLEGGTIPITYRTHDSRSFLDDYISFIDLLVSRLKMQSCEIS